MAAAVVVTAAAEIQFVHIHFHADWINNKEMKMRFQLNDFRLFASKEITMKFPPWIHEDVYLSTCALKKSRRQSEK